MPNNANIDERVVEMRIDNRQFVDGAEKTISVLDRLKEALSFKKAGDGFSEVQRAADRIDLSGMANGVQAISDRFTTLGLVGQRVIQNLTDSVYGFVKSTVTGLTIDPITQGFSKYEDILRNTQTIMSATMNEEIPARFGSQLEYVDHELEMAAWYTDETSASLQDIVSNVSKFTNVGVPLQDALYDMQGIANWGWSAGASVQEMSRAMYNLSQAMSVGSVKLMDWRSIENANMGTLEFKQTAIDTAVALGTLIDVGDGLYQTLEGNAVSAKNFNDALKDEWFTADVLEQTLRIYGDYSRRLGEVMNDMGMTDAGLAASDVMEAVDKVSEAVEKGMTIDEALAAWQEELSSSFTEETLPSIEQLRYAYQLLTGDEDALAEHAAAMGAEWEKLTKEQFELSKRAFLMGQEYKTFQDVIDATKDAVSTGWMKTFQLIIGNAEEAKEVWTEVGGVFYDIFAAGAARRNAILKWWKSPGEGIESGRDSFLKAISNVYNAVKGFVEPIKTAFDNIFSWGPAEKAGEKLRNITKAFEKFTEKLVLSEKAGEGMRNFFEAIFRGVKKVTDLFKPLIKFIGTAIVTVRDFVNLFFESFASGKFDKQHFLSGLPDVFKNIGDNVKAAWEGVKSFIDSIKDIPIVGTVVKALQSVFSLIKNTFTTVRGWFSGDSIFATIQEKIQALREFLAPVFDWLREQYQSIKDRVTELFSGDGLGIKKVLAIFAGLAGLRIGKGLFDGAKWNLTAIIEPLKNLIGFFGDLDDAVWGFVQETRIKALKNFAVAMLILAGALVVLSLVDAKKLGASLAVLAGALVEMVGSLALLSKTNTLKGNPAKGLIKLAASVLVFSLALMVLSKIDEGKLINGLSSVFFLLMMILGFIAAVNLLGIKPKAIKGVFSLAMAMLVFTGVIYILGSIPYKKLEQGLVSLAIALLIVSAAMIAISKFGGAKALLAGLGMVFLATAIVILVGALALLTLINPEKAAASLLILAGALAVVAIAVAVMPATLPLIGVGLIAVSVAILLITGALMALTVVDPAKLADALMIMGIALAALAVSLLVMSAAIPGALALLVASVAFVVVAASLIVLAVALRLFQNLPMDAIAAGFVMIGGSLIILAVGLLAMTVGIVGAVALVIASVGLIALSAALNLMTGLDLPGIAGGLTLLGLSFIPLGAGGIILGLGAVGIIAGAAAIALMALALIPFVSALEKLSGISFGTIVDYLLLIGGTAGTLALLTPVLTPLAVAVGVFGAACLAAGAGIDLAGSGMVKIADSIKSIPGNIGTTFKSAAKEIGDSVTEFAPNGEKVVNEVNAIGVKIQNEILLSGANLKTVIGNTLNDLVKAISAYDESFKTAGYNTVVGIANGIYSGNSIVIDAMHFLAEAMITQFQRDFNMHSPSVLMEELSQNIGLGVARGVDGSSDYAVGSVNDLSTRMTEAMRTAMTNLAALSQEDFTISPVITPVVDMTNVENEARNVSSMFQNPGTGQANGISRNMASAQATANNMRNAGESTTNISQDQFTINVYGTADMDENELSDLVLQKLMDNLARKGASLG